MNIFIFWYGTINKEVEKRIQEIKDNFKECNVHIGPTPDEHNNFMNNKYYKEAFNLKKYTWMSNYARAYWAFNYGGIYFDVFTNYNINGVKSLFKNEKEVFFKGETCAVMSSFFKANKSSQFFGKVLSIYNTWSLNPMFATCPAMYSLILWRIKILSYTDKSQENNDVLLLTKEHGYDINGIKIFAFNGQGTWNTNVDPIKEKEKIINNWLKEKKDGRFNKIYMIMGNRILKIMANIACIIPIPKRSYIRELSKLDTLIKKSIKK